MQASSRVAPFIVFEGIDGAGTTTQATLLHERLVQSNVACHLSGEPSKGPIGMLLRQGLTGRLDFDERVMALLFAADRLDHLHDRRTGVNHHTSNGVVEISDRYVWSSLAYQGVTLPFDWIRNLNHLADEPDLVCFLDIEAADALRRVSTRQEPSERYEKLHFLTQVVQHYRRLARASQQRFAEGQSRQQLLWLDATRSKADLAEAVWQQVVLLIRTSHLFAGDESI